MRLYYYTLWLVCYRSAVFVRPLPVLLWPENICIPTIVSSARWFSVACTYIYLDWSRCEQLGLILLFDWRLKICRIMSAYGSHRLLPAKYWLNRLHTQRENSMERWRKGVRKWEQDGRWRGTIGVFIRQYNCYWKTPFHRNFIIDKL